MMDEVDESIWVPSQAEMTAELVAGVLARDTNDLMPEDTRVAIAAEFWKVFCEKRLEGVERYQALRETYDFVLHKGTWAQWRKAGGLRNEDGMCVDGRRVRLPW